MTGLRVWRCDRCGFEMIERHCKVLCPNCGARWDCSDVTIWVGDARRAVLALDGETDVERALIEAVNVRYAPVPPADRAALDSAYAGVMARVVEHFPLDPEAHVLYAESLMDLSPWRYWTPEGEPREGTAELLAILEATMAAAPDHPSCPCKLS